MLPGFSANTLAIVVALVAAAIALLAAWITTVPAQELAIWVGPALLAGTAICLVLAVIAGIVGFLAWLRYPATVIVVDGGPEVVIGFWDAVDVMQRRTRFGQDFLKTFSEEEYLEFVRVRLLDDFRDGHVAFFGRLPHATAYRRIDRPEFAAMFFDGENAILYMDEQKKRPYRVQIAVRYKDVKFCISRMLRGR
jgi:hypothetical protein